MKKVATITFHWATNYGAVLQSFALQKYLQKCGVETEVIDYVPFRVKLLTSISWIKQSKYGEFRKEKLINKFREKELNLSQRRYRSSNSLKRGKFDYEFIIAGSDQIWNKNFTMNLDGKPNLSYFMDFCDNKAIKLTYAVSFGADQMPEEYYDLVRPFASEIRAISVREESAVPIVEHMEKEATVVCDPTLLLDRYDYECLIEKKQYQCQKVYSYILHDNQHTAHLVAKEVKRIYKENDEMQPLMDMYEWLYRIKHSEIVVTNSFHGMMMALIFNTAFLVIPVDGSQMNDRISTILKIVNLENRIVNSFNKDDIQSLCENRIDWELVNEALSRYALTGKRFLLSNLAIETV